MAARDWSKVDWTNNEDNNLIREFLADSDNIMNCNQCPYKMKHPSWDALPCGQYHCWVELEKSAALYFFFIRTRKFQPPL